MIAIPILQSAIFITYFWYITSRFGILSSISDSWYHLQGLRRLYFTAFMWSIGLSTLLLHSYGWFYIVSGVLLPLVGVAAAFREKVNNVNTLHNIGATGAIAAVLIALAFNHIYYPLALSVVFSIGARRLKISNSTTWEEVICFAIAEIGLFQLLA